MYLYDTIIYETAKKNGFTPTAAKFVVAQARLESADYTSNVFINNFNTSGMKYIGQPLASKGTIAPYNERSSSCKSGGVCINSDYYAKFKSVEDSAKDKIERLYNKTMYGVTPNQLKNASTPEEFASLLKQRRYFGFSDYNTDAGKEESYRYAKGLNAKLLIIKIQEVYTKNTGKIWTVVGVVLIALSVYLYQNKNKINWMK
jgi:hypothetical protein